MKRLEVSDIREIKLFKYYRLVRKWACRKYGLNDADLELLIYLDCIGTFDKTDFETGVWSYAWDARRWSRLLRDDWVRVWRTWNKREGRANNLYVTSRKTKLMINRMYNIMLGNEDIPIGKSNDFYTKQKTYSEKAYARLIDEMRKDPDR